MEGQTLSYREKCRTKQHWLRTMDGLMWSHKDTGPGILDMPVFYTRGSLEMLFIIHRAKLLQLLFLSIQYTTRCILAVIALSDCQ